MSGRVAVVTGAASGIGLGVAKRLAADGIAVALLDRDGAGAATAAEELSSQGSKAISWEVDVADRGELERVFSEVRQQLGPITILVTSAGIESFDAVADITPEKWDRLLAVNLTGTFTCMQLAVPDMTAAGLGPDRDHLLVERAIGSAQHGALRGVEGRGHRSHESLRPEFASQGITVNTIPPTIVDTPMARKAAGVGNVPNVDVMGRMVPTGRAGTPEDIAGACAFLCSEEAGYITGQLIGVNGGMYI